MHTLHLNTSSPYDIHIGPGILEHAVDYISNVLSSKKTIVVTDSNVYLLYGCKLCNSLAAHGYEYDTFVFPAGEQSKNLHTLSNLLEFLAAHQLTRSDFIIALGGGVTGDITGFAASVYARGISFVQIPTTLLSAVDASVGGKTAVNLTAGKNLAGSFHQPALVLTDTSIMKALPNHLLSEGAAEIIKCGVLQDAALFDLMCREDWMEHLPEAILRSLEIKRFYVTEDEKDLGLRKFLNLGHTFGHAIEKLSRYSIPHGYAVAIGTAMAASAQKDLCKKIIQANTNCRLPSTTAYDAKQLAEAALLDKKRNGTQVDLILAEEIGRCKMVSLPVENLESLFIDSLETIKELMA